MTIVMQVPLGRVMMTPGVAALIANQPALSVALVGWLARHARGECPNLSEDDQRENARPIQHGFRVVSSWTVGRGNNETPIWIITEADRSATTVLLPSEY